MWGQLGGPVWYRDGQARGRDHRGGPSGSLGRRYGEGGVAGGQGRSVDASAGESQNTSWSAMVKTGSLRISGGAQARTIKRVVFAKTTVSFLRAHC